MPNELIDRYENFDLVVEEGVLIIKINVNEDEVEAKPSASGKNLVIATTGGATRIPGTEWRLNLTLYHKL